jgi:hypothetical protein
MQRTMAIRTYNSHIVNRRNCPVLPRIRKELHVVYLNAIRSKLTEYRGKVEVADFADRSAFS